MAPIKVFTVEKISRRILWKKVLIEQAISVMFTILYFLSNPSSTTKAIYVFIAFFVCWILHWMLTNTGRWPYQIELFSDGIILRSQALFKTTSKAISGSQLIVFKITYLDKKRSNVLLFKNNKHGNGLSLSTETNWPKEVLDEILHTLKELNMGKIYYEENQWSNPFKIGKGENK